MNTYKLVNYFDVWGNQKDGYEINNLCTEIEGIVLVDGCQDTDLLKYLKSIGFFKKHVRLNMLSIEDYSCMGDYIEISEKRTGKPICRFEREYSHETTK
jgi:hypothetical protein